MCGIAGLYKSDGRLTRGDVEAVLRMLDAQVHRGPDDWGILLPAALFAREEIKNLFASEGLNHVSTYEGHKRGPAVILGSRRLSILDLSARGRMPMTNSGNSVRTRGSGNGVGTTWVTHNGEIYNSPELREELRRAGYAFQSSSDTEVLLNGYEHWGYDHSDGDHGGSTHSSSDHGGSTHSGGDHGSGAYFGYDHSGDHHSGDNFLSHLRGMFAFALFDSVSASLLLARDRFGIKPLYYSRISNFGFRNSNFVGSELETRNPTCATSKFQIPNSNSEIQISRPEATKPEIPNSHSEIPVSSREATKFQIPNSKFEIFLFASEVRALLRSKLVEFEPEPEAAVRFLQLGSVPAPLTTVKNVFALPAGHTLSIRAETSKLSRYWSLGAPSQHSVLSPQHFSDVSELETRNSKLETALLASRRLLDESVQHHLLSDVPLGIFLSGGIDSSALVALAASFRSEPLTTLSIVFDEPEYDESKYARLIADKYQTSHCETRLTSKELVAGLPEVFAAMDQPTIDGVNSFFVSRAAKQAGLKVVLSGLGGDEVFLGYSHLHKAHSLNRAQRLFKTLPAAVRRGLIQLAIPAGKAAGRNGLEKLAYLQEPSSTNMYLLFRGLFVPDQIQRLLGLSEAEIKRYGVAPESINPSISRSINPSIDPSINPSINASSNDWMRGSANGSGGKTGATSLLDSFALNDFQHYLQNQLLKDTDCMSMAHSIETRVPFLDHKLVEYVFGLPAEFKLNGGMNKPLLIKALGDDLPREIWDRPKMGFTFPFDSWLRDSRDAYQTSDSTAGILDRREVDKIWAGFRSKRCHWSRPWALMVLEQFASPTE